MTPEEIPQELMAILDRAAGKTHSREGAVTRTLAEILTAYDRIKAGEAAQKKPGSIPCVITLGPPPEPEVRIVPVPVEWPMRERR